MTPITKFSLAKVLILAALTNTASASTTIFNSFGPGGSYGGVGGSSVTSTSVSHGVEFEQAFKFTPTGAPGETFDFSSVELPLRVFAGANVLEVRLWTDLGNMPNTLLETITLDGMLSSTASIVTGVSTSNSTLHVGENYWLGLFSDGTGTAVSVSGVNGASGTSAYKRNGAAWAFNLYDGINTHAVGMKINAVPEPSTVILFAFGVCSLSLRRSRR